MVNVADPNLRQWNVESTGDDQTITVGLFQPARDRQSILIELERFQPEEQGTVSVPTVEAVGVGRQRGVVLVRLTDSLRGETIRRTGLSQLDREEVPEHLRNTPWAHSFQYASLPFDLALQVAQVEPRIQVDHLVEAFVDPLGVTLELFANYDIQRAGVFELLLDLPPGYEVQQVRGHAAAGAQAAVVDTHLVDESEPDRPRLRVNLAAKAQGPTGLRVDLLRRLDDPNLLSPTGQSTSLSLVPPRAADPRLARSSGRLVVYAPESLRVSIDQLDGLRNVSFEEAFQEMASQRGGRYAEMRPVQAMFFSDATASTTLSIQRKQPYVTAQQLLEVRIEPGVTKYVATFYYNILYSGVKSLRIDLPAEIASRVRNQTKSLRESALEEADGLVGWVLEGESELLGDQQVKLTWESPIEDLGLGKSVDLQVPRLMPREVDRAEGQVVLVKSETIDVQPKGTPEGLDPIDPEHDLIGTVRIPDAAAALEFQDDWELTLTATRYQLQMLKQTSIEQAVLRMVITRSDRVAVQALYRMRSNRQRLQIRLPEQVVSGKTVLDADPLRINGRRATLEEGGDSQSYFVPLVGLNADQPFLLELRYTMAGGAEKLVYPSFPDEPATQKVNLVAYVPQERTFLGMMGPWTDELRWVRRGVGGFGVQRPVPRTSVQQLLGQLTQGIAVTGNPAEDFPVDGQPLLFSTLRPPAPDVGALRLHTISTRWLYGLMFGLVSLVGMALVWRPLRERIIVVCTFLAALVLLGVFLPTFSRAILNQILLLAVALVLLLWLVVFFLRSLSRLSQWNPEWPWSRTSQHNSDAPVECVASSATTGQAAGTEQADADSRQEGGTHDES